METQFRRLAWLIAVASLVGCSVGAAWLYYKEKSMQQAVTVWYENLNRSIAECEKDRQSIYCESIEYNKREFDEAVQIRNHYSDVVETNLVTLFSLPLAALLLFLALRWVITGKKPGWLMRGK